jgi:hypothetical protein
MFDGSVYPKHLVQMFEYYRPYCIQHMQCPVSNEAVNDRVMYQSTEVRSASWADDCMPGYQLSVVIDLPLCRSLLGVDLSCVCPDALQALPQARPVVCCAVISCMHPQPEIIRLSCAVLCWHQLRASTTRNHLSELCCVVL